MRHKIAVDVPAVPTISFCTSVKDRVEHIQATLLQNLEVTRDDPRCDFVLLDYNCPDRRTKPWIQNVLSSSLARGRLMYLFFPAAAGFARSHARNLTLKACSGDIFCNVDADNFIGFSFASYIRRFVHEGATFIRGPADGRGLRGRFAAFRNDILAIGGFDEHLVDWGGEDRDLQNRLRRHGLRGRIIRPERYLRSIQHGDDMRVKHHQMKDKRSSMIANRTISDEHAARGRLNPNDSRFGEGRVQKNFTEWIDL